ncbi:hypothetical protein L6452_04413 [Arctium lappa]|uniref:Uncharacterized protein n=1 Tax=Arctium lappa TaxID=4217 RepID=A0ACB9FPZ6_ARCLA|nr:hypothetical protein L6452_04413 [Arctium lappa]
MSWRQRKEKKRDERERRKLGKEGNTGGYSDPGLGSNPRNKISHRVSVVCVCVCDKKSKKWRRLRVVFPRPPPLSLPLYSPYHYPQNTQTLITHSFSLSLPVYIHTYIHKRSVLLYLYYIVFSLSSLSYTSPFIISQGFPPFLPYADRCYLNFGPFHLDYFMF